MVIAISNQKGGVGKSTTAGAVSVGLKKKGYHVLAVDLDAQGNMSYSMGVDKSAITSLEILTGTARAKEAVINTQYCDLIPAGATLATAELIIKNVGREYKLREALEEVKNDYDYIIIDCPPALGLLTVNALTACNGVIIPAQADIYSLQGFNQLEQVIQTVKKYCNNGLSIMGILVTRYNARTVLSRDMLSMLSDTARHIQTKVFDTKIRECTAIKEAQASQQNIFDYAPKSNATIDYTSLIEELKL